MKYPYITIDQRKPVLIYKDRRGIYMVDKNDTLSDLDITYAKRQKNQTAKVLANTYGEVKSKAHAEFIVKLAENHGYSLTGAVNKSNARTFVIDGENKLLFFMRGSSSFNGSTVKQITIPLPPECESVDEWPKVGDTVSLRYRFDSKQVMYTGDLLYLSSNHIIIRTENGNDCHCIRSEWDIEKPKTPEQELEYNLTDLIMRARDADADDVMIARSILSKYNITKKPQ